MSKGRLLQSLLHQGLFFAVLTWYVVSLVLMFPLNSVALEVADRRVKTSLGKIFNHPLASDQHRTARYEEGLQVYCRCGSDMNWSSYSEIS